MDVNILREIVTVASLGAFVGIWAWAWARSNRSRFEEAGRIPFEQE